MANAKSELCRRYDAVLKAVAALDRTYYLDSRPQCLRPRQVQQPKGLFESDTNSFLCRAQSAQMCGETSSNGDQDEDHRGNSIESRF